MNYYKTTIEVNGCLKGNHDVAKLFCSTLKSYILSNNIGLIYDGEKVLDSTGSIVDNEITGDSSTERHYCIFFLKSDKDYGIAFDFYTYYSSHNYYVNLCIAPYNDKDSYKPVSNYCLSWVSPFGIVNFNFYTLNGTSALINLVNENYIYNTNYNSYILNTFDVNNNNVSKILYGYHNTNNFLLYEDPLKQSPSCYFYLDSINIRSRASGKIFIIPFFLKETQYSNNNYYYNSFMVEDFYIAFGKTLTLGNMYIIDGEKYLVIFKNSYSYLLVKIDN